MEVANRLVNTENEGDPSQADVASNNDDDGSHDIEESFLFNPAILDALTKPNMPPASSARQLDTIYLRNQKISAVIGPDAWNRAGKPQPIVLSLQLQIDTTSASTTDDLKNTFSYGQMCKDITAKLDGKTFTSMEHLTSDLAGLADHWPGETLQLQALAPKGMLRVEGGFGRDFCLRRVETQTQGRKTLNWHVASHEWVVKGLKLGCIIGVNPHERLEKQNISIDLRILGEPEVADYTLQTKGGFDTWRQLVKKISEAVESSSFGTLEALAGFIAQVALEGYPVPQITVSIEKPSALIYVDGAGVEIVRRKVQSPNTEPDARAQD